MRAALLSSIVAIAGCDLALGLERDSLEPGDWATVAAGDRHTSLPTEIAPTSATPVPWTGTWSAVALGTRHTCAIDDAHRLWSEIVAGGDVAVGHWNT